MVALSKLCQLLFKNALPEIPSIKKCDYYELG